MQSTEPLARRLTSFWMRPMCLTAAPRETCWTNARKITVPTSAVEPRGLRSRWGLGAARHSMGMIREGWDPGKTHPSSADARLEQTGIAVILADMDAEIVAPEAQMSKAARSSRA